MSPEPEPEADKEAESGPVDLKPEVLLETQAEPHATEERVEKAPAPATADPAPTPAEPAPTAPEENRVRLAEPLQGYALICFC